MKYKFDKYLRKVRRMSNTQLLEKYEKFEDKISLFNDLLWASFIMGTACVFGGFVALFLHFL